MLGGGVSVMVDGQSCQVEVNGEGLKKEKVDNKGKGVT